MLRGLRIELDSDDPGATGLPDSIGIETSDGSPAAPVSKARPAAPKLWSEVKGAYMTLQHGKCAYCERLLEGKLAFDVEHSPDFTNRFYRVASP